MTRNDKLTSDRILVRFFWYSDPYMGYGDAGTVGFAYIPLKYFKESKEKRADGSTYYSYQLSREGFKLCGHSNMDCGCEFATIDDVEKEIKRVEKIIAANKEFLKNLKNI